MRSTRLLRQKTSLKSVVHPNTINNTTASAKSKILTLISCGTGFYTGYWAMVFFGGYMRSKQEEL